MGDSEQADATEPPDADDAAHLADVDAGSGCIEIWEYLSERRADAGADDATAGDDE